MATFTWTRAKVGTASGLLGLTLGAGLAAAGQEPVDATNPEVKALVSAGVEKQASPLEDENDELRDELDEARAEAADAADAAAEAEQQVAAAKAEARKAVKLAKVSAAKAKAAAEQAAAAKRAASQPAPTYGLTGSGSSSGGSSGGGSDPLFGTCGEANAHGYGNYHQGQDSEYSNYQDRDHDGVVCEF